MQITANRYVPRSSLCSGLILFTLLLVSANAPAGGPSQPHATIIQAAEAYLKMQTADRPERITLKLLPLDHRLKLNRCETPLQSFSPPGARSQGRTTVGIKCESPKPWTLYVSAEIGVIGKVVVAKRDLARGAAIGPNDVKLVEQETSHLLRGHFDSIAEVTGRTLKRTLRRDKPVTPSLLVVNKTIRRGQQVTIIAGNSDIRVQMKGKALSNGNPGDLIKVQNLSSKRKLQARVVSASLVRAD
ncbi:flagellar basal body P-ring formation chaperone FlgA [endosymbiont of Ridgeia piscesae]|uniref:Flagella basal body P-ring formation protein FlgA n=1 Tax=endosymbiont of Ridgeia piscesae TaxID=54398 RepID=A0A0T5Z1C6_9GAMM|nr:flagellar basal body P-ring formation chaperone FlgA [endosymbiont of Ridgeia piscesae]KRT56302.1 flagella basal body P-ring formation protein FlgA [endosymbiont of Ridgeia piscesae]KRT58816.1 flagella basal body P-ring formation protein FlgA [endosymbiont of Ridgeia piscesae]